ncbi:MAG: hypothetical protein HFI09_02465 [Bacilli bacterium]|nr:hypothetical protein [Bacilli bacterium]
MKKTILTVLFAFLLGGVLSGLAIYELKDKLNFTLDDNTVTAFQVGVYKSFENAQKASENHPGSITIKDGDYFRVFIGVAKGTDWTTSLESYYLSKNVVVYPKEVKVTSSFIKELSKYEPLITKTDSAIYDEINGEILKKMEGELL